MTMENLSFTCIPHAAWVPRADTKPADGLVGLAAVRYYRFDRRVRVSRFRLCPTAIRWAPMAYTRPDHIIISRFIEGDGWETVADLHLPVIAEGEWHDIDIGCVETDHLRVVCDREHPVEECHGDFAYATWNVPFRILEKVEWLGGYMDEIAQEPPYQPPLRVGALRPSVPVGMKLIQTANEIHFRSPAFHVGFSLIRPMVTYLAWDVLGSGLVDRSLSCHDSRLARRFNKRWPSDLVSGPWFSGLREEAPSIYWTGEVSVEGSKVSYRNLRLIDGLSLDVVFTVYADGMDISIHQRAERDLYAPEFEAWRFMWKAGEAITGTVAIPISDTGRTGLVDLPAMWSAPGHGLILIQQTDGDQTFLRVDSVRNEQFGMSGIVLGTEHDEYGLVKIKKGEHHASLSLRTYELLPTLSSGVQREDVPVGLRRNWPISFASRPEHGGFSSNNMSAPCLMCNHDLIDMCAYTPVPKSAPSLMDLARYTTGLAMKGGPGYGEIRDMFMDTDPSLLCCAGRIHQADPKRNWLEEMKPWIKDAARRIIDQFDENGLYLCRRLSGNSGSGRWSSNLWDVVSFGHYDGYSNAMAYRALRNTAVLMSDAGDAAFARRCSEIADALKVAYKPCFFNPDTGWLGGWRSRDGQLHDYAFTFINGMAICLGLVEGEEARSILERLEAKREESGFRDFHHGLPTNFISIRREDVPIEQQGRREDGLDMFGIYVNGCVTTHFLEHYLSALSRYGFTETADRICDHVEESLADNRIVGGIFTGTEFFTWYGAPCGYEGVLQGQFRVMLAIAQHRGLVPRLEPEWWPQTNVR